ncbi:unnamed protein product, partial [marine sediment metagenome]
MTTQESRRILIVSDVHANYRALKAVIDRFGSADEIWCLGDIVEFGPSPAKCIDLLRECGARTVQGNHDEDFTGEESKENGWASWDAEVTTEHLKYLAGLPATLTIHLDGSSFFLVHGSPRDHFWGSLVPNDSLEAVREKIAGCDADYILSGHTHVPMFLQAADQLIVNAGAAGQPEDGDSRAQCMLYENRSFRFERVEYDLDALADDYQSCGLPDDLKKEVLSWQKA